MKRILYLSIFIMMVCSCSESLDGISSENSHEVINGFDVAWRRQITSQQKDVIREILNDMVFVEGGYFTMGATPEQADLARNNEYPNMYIFLSDYYICRHEVSDGQFNIITGLNLTSTEKYPSSTTLNDWRIFFSILKDLCSIEFSFPSEAQWEYAARGGKRTQGYIYPGSNDFSQVHSNSCLVGSQVPNELGIYNLADLKSEWCEDFYDSFPIMGLKYDWVNRNGKYHVVRGGSYLCRTETDQYYSRRNSLTDYNFHNGQKYINPESDYRHCRITSRSYAYDLKYGDIGCRMVINLNVNHL